MTLLPWIALTDSTGRDCPGTFGLTAERKRIWSPVPVQLTTLSRVERLAEELDGQSYYRRGSERNDERPRHDRSDRPSRNPREATALRLVDAFQFHILRFKHFRVRHRVRRRHSRRGHFTYELPLLSAGNRPLLTVAGRN